MGVEGDAEKFRKSVSRFRSSVVASKSMANIFSDSVDKLHDDTSSITVDVSNSGRKGLPSMKYTTLRYLNEGFLMLISSTYYNFCMSPLILFGAIGDDIRLISATGSQFDSQFDIALFVVFCVLGFELILKLMWKPLYILSPWMLLDCIGTLSIFFRLLTQTQGLGGRFNSVTGGDSTYNVVLGILLLIGQICLILRLVRQVLVSKFIRKTLKAVSVYTKLTWSTWHSARKRRASELAEASKSSDKMKRGYSKSRSGAGRSYRATLSRMSLIGDGPSVGMKSVLRKSVTALVKDFDFSSDSDSSSLPQESLRVGTQTRMNLDESLGLPSNPFSIGRTILANLSPSDIADQFGEESRLVRAIKERSILLTGFLVITLSVIGYICFLPSVAISDSNYVARMVSESLDSGYVSGDPLVYQLSLVSAVATATTVTQGLVKIAWIGSLEENIRLNSTVESNIPTELIGRLKSVWTLRCFDVANATYVSLRYGPTDCPSDVVRPMDIEVVYSESGSWDVVTDASDATYWTAVFSLIFSCFVFTAALVAAELYLKICDSLILHRLSRITRSVNRVRAKPGSASRLYEKFLQIELESEMKRMNLSWKRKIFRNPPPILKVDELFELERDVLKICSLLTVGFGKEGTEVVVRNIRDTDEEGLKVVSDSGNSVECVFGYISICNFETITEVLESRMIMFVNEIAEIVHGIVDEFSGFTCTSTGDGFFVVWKIGQESRERVCELAILACLEILLAVRRSPVLGEYRSHPHLKNRLKNFQVELGMSLHLGVGIEGAIGSEIKLEANYLGHHAVVVQRLEHLANRVYRVPLVVTLSLCDSVSRDFKNALCRRIDRIDIDGFTTEVFAVDVELMSVKILEHATTITTTADIVAKKKLVELHNKKTRIGRRKKKLDVNSDYEPLELVMKSKDMILIRGKYMAGAGELFRQMFEKGLVNYEAGEWELAEQALRQTLVFWTIHTTREERATSPRSSMHASGSAHADEPLSKLLDSIDVCGQGIDGPSCALLSRMIRMEVHRKQHWNGVWKL